MGFPFVPHACGLRLSLWFVWLPPVAGQSLTEPKPAIIRRWCQSCAIDVGPATPAFGYPQGFDQRPSDLVWRTDGSVVLLKAGHGGVPRLFTSASAFRDLGRNGAGPGEYRAALLGAADADTVYVFDRLNQRLSVLDPSGTVVRSAPAPPGTLDLIWLPGRRELIVNAHIPDRNRIGLAYHAFDPVGNQLRSFAESEKPVVGANAWNVVWRRTVVDPMGNLVASTVLGEVRIEKWSPDGLLMASHLLRLPEFRAPMRAPPDQPSPPPPSVEALWIEPAQVLWLVVLVAGKRWRDGIGLTRVQAERTWRVDWIDPMRYQDTKVFAVDLARGLILASARVTGTCRFFTNRGGLLCDAENGDGTYRLDARQLRVVGGNTGAH